MKKILSLIASFFLAFGANAQVQEARLQASGLTCSMCSKAVLNALQKIPFVQKVDVDIDKQEYTLAFKAGAAVDPDALSGAVEDAGFSVAKLDLTAKLDPQKVEKDKHITIGGKTYHFLNAKGQELPATATFKVVDKSFVSEKEFKKVSSLSSMACVITGKMETCCTKAPGAAARVYHVML
ncbi:Copper chaperone CopZ [Cnuella takakiae]|uniref:Copper chaperone CopZ n=1 Tax=Cnuella takakiae TaxID=1302690 RepID=A0A1M5AHY7_9BACT|nr:heavy-metal-associated domain-containing protein [Cnuella takakiae]OLY91956.1 hypothetical protein BUE76_08660 [Cnuella takakiae]SHF29755.1 Copper chaperone CopZ [Cnuella takakiae]